MKNTLTSFFAVAALTLALAAPVTQAAPSVGSAAPDFSLTDLDGKSHKLSDFKGKVVVLEWLNYGCPFVKKHYDGKNMQTLQKKYTGQDVVWLSITSTHPDHENFLAPDKLKEKAARYSAAGTAILMDNDGKVGAAYDAKTTPAMYIIDKEGKLAYSGAIDDKPTANAADVEGSKNYVSAALDEVLAGKAVSSAVTKSYGCSVKYTAK